MDPHENLIEVEGITVTPMPTPKASGILRAEFDTPQPDRLVADRDTTLRHKFLDIAATQIEAMIEPDNVLIAEKW